MTAESIAAACEMQPHNKGSGFSLVLRDVPKRVAAVAELVNSIEQQLGLPAGANLYYTPPGRVLSCTPANLIQLFLSAGRIGNEAMA